MWLGCDKYVYILGSTWGNMPFMISKEYKLTTLGTCFLQVLQAAKFELRQLGPSILEEEKITLMDIHYNSDNFKDPLVQHF